MKLKYITVILPILILILYLFYPNKSVNEITEYTKQISSFEDANDVIINHLEKICTGGCRSMNRYYFEQTILKNNTRITQDLQKIIKLWDTNLLSSDVTKGYITVQADTVISYQIALFDKGILSNAFIHEIVYDPQNSYKENFVDGGWKVIHVIQIKPKWKYLIIEDVLDD
jgi:uncharacterized membrane protein